MVDLVLRPSGLPEKLGKPWALQLRYGGMPETEYRTLCRVDDDTARDIIEAGTAYWLFGEPDWDDRARKRMLQKAEDLRAEADLIQAAAGS